MIFHLSCGLVLLVPAAFSSRSAAQQTANSTFSDVDPRADRFVHNGANERRTEKLQDESFRPTDPQQLFAPNGATTDGRSNHPTPEPIVIPPEEAVARPDEQISHGLQVPSESTFSDPVDGEIHSFDSSNEADQRLNVRRLNRDPYKAYRTEQNSLAWLPGGGQDFGWLDWKTDPYLHRDDHAGLTSAFNIHWLSGPDSTPLPPRLYEFTLGYQLRDSFSPQLSYDLFTSVGVYSDFEGSAREGVRFLSHAVGILHVNRSTDVVFGIDYLDRDDIAVVPVIGVSLHDTFLQGLRMDLVFPRPRVDYALSDSNRIYLSGELDGGTWDIEFPGGAADVATYRDYRLILGFETADDDGSLSAWEFGYVFGRQLELRNGTAATPFDDAFVLRWVSRR